MQLWLVLLGCALVLGAIAVFGALQLELEGRAFGEPSGNWACAFGLGTGPLLLSGTTGNGVPLRLELRLFGRRFALRRGRQGQPSPANTLTLPKLESADWARIGRWLQGSTELDPLLRLGRYIDCKRVEIDANYGFRDIALTGRVAGVLYALSGALPESVTLTQNPSWDGGERWQLGVSGRVAVVLGLVLLELLWYMLRARFRRTQPARVDPRPA